MRILVTGSRDWTDKDSVKLTLRIATWHTWPSSVLVVHGANGQLGKDGRPTTGLDLIAAEAAVDLGMKVEDHRADWAMHGKAAGPIRNNVMVGSGIDLCLAWPLGESKGTRGCMELAGMAGIPVINLGDPEPSKRVLDDGFGNSYLTCNRPGGCRLEIVRPGKTQCSETYCLG